QDLLLVAREVPAGDSLPRRTSCPGQRKKRWNMATIAATADTMASSLGSERCAVGTGALGTEAGISGPGRAPGRACATAAGAPVGRGAGGTRMGLSGRALATMGGGGRAGQRA